MPDTMKIATCARILEELAEDMAATRRLAEWNSHQWSAGSEIWKIYQTRAGDFAEAESRIRAAIRGLSLGSAS